MQIKQYEFYYKLRTLKFVEQIWLFGSRAKESPGARSDIDLAILCPSASKEEWQEVLDIIENADTLLKIDCIRFDVLVDARLRREIEETKVILFQRVKNNYVWYEIFLDLKESLDKFQEIVKYNRDTLPFVVEASIQIFEYSFELYWKVLQKICRQEGLEASSPRSVLMQAYSIGLIDDQQVWLEMLEDRNLTSHTYKQPEANIVSSHLKYYVETMLKTYDNIKLKFDL